MSLTFSVPGGSVAVDPTAVVIAGFTGRDRAGVEAHLAELRELGVPTPAAVPAFYVTPGIAAVQVNRLSVVGAETSGEAEAVLIFDGDDVYLTLGSDHTDRAAETIDIALSKQACAKPLATVAWPLAEVAGHLDDLEIRSWITDEPATPDDGSAGGTGQDDSSAGGTGQDDGECVREGCGCVPGRPPGVLYQEGRLGELLALDDLLKAAPFTKQPQRFVLFTGTFPAIGGIRPAAHFHAELSDPVLGRSMSFGYDIHVLNVLQPGP